MADFKCVQCRRAGTRIHFCLDHWNRQFREAHPFAPTQRI
jgi:hypothetical protein